MNKKPYTQEGDLKEAFDDLARDNALIEPYPVDWGRWASYMLEQLEGEAEKHLRIGDFENMLRTLAVESVNRLDSGKW